MATAPHEILSLALSLCSVETEAGSRSAISRAYYAVYHGCLEWEKTFPAPGSNGGTAGGIHQQLINRLRNPAPELKDDSTKGLCRRVAALLEGLKTKRKAADYHLFESFHTLDARNACALADDLLARIAKAGGIPSVPASASDKSAQQINKERPHTADSSLAPSHTLEASPEPDPIPPTPPAGTRPVLRRVR